MSKILRLPPAKNTAAIVVALVVAEAVSAFELSMMYVALPTLIRDFHTDTNTVAWVITAYMLVSASAAALGGRLGDMYGRRRVLLAALTLAAVGSLISVLGGSLLLLVIGRAVQGAAGAVLGLAFGLARQHLNSERAVVGLSIVGASALVAGSVGSFIAGGVIDTFSWHGIFIFAMGLAVLAVIVVAAIVPRDHVVPTKQPLDTVGAVLLPVAVTAFLLALSFAGKTGFTSPIFLGLIAGGVAVSVLWVVWELRVKNPIVNIRMFSNRHIALVMLATFLAGAGPIGGNVAASIIPQYPASPVTEVGLGLSPTLSGLLTACTSFLGFALSPVGGIITRKVGAKLTFVVGLGFSASSIIVMMTTYGHLIPFIAAVALNAIGISLVFGALPNVLFEAAPAAHSSEVSGANTMVRNIGQSAGVAVAGYFLGMAYDPTTSLTQTQGFTTAFLFALSIALLSVLTALLIRKNPAPWVPIVGSGMTAEVQEDVRPPSDSERAPVIEKPLAGRTE